MADNSDMDCKPKIAALVLCVAFSARADIDFQPQMTEAGWIFKVSDSRCELFQHIANYGTAVFVQVSGQPQEFHLNAHRRLFEEQPMSVIAEAPPWHKSYPHTEVLGRVKAVTGDRVTVTEPLATNLLMTLYNGQSAAFRQQSWFDDADRVAVRLSNIAFREKYDAYARCQKTHRSDNFARLERSSVFFDVDRWELTPKTRKRLDMLADYCKVHPEVKRVYVDGHTDNSGTRNWNLVLSKHRAEAVTRYLQQKGLNKEMLVTRYHAERYPIASNDTEEGKARNRRTTVRLEKSKKTMAVR